ncbi:MULTISPECIES: GcrA family cell cycle regulator [unclassified Caulobacter]|uniref:GcrA family cell cycle regulator n=1 Tax=unclassified Caulobacter TaxID=2648921 RepID=UPI0009EB70B9|nr:MULTISPECIES: GcrA family cell cycle regulator [unclassified Caulobacter]
MSSSVIPSVYEQVSGRAGGWSEARVERLKALLAQGQSASQIAKALGSVSRNAVIGKIHRLGLAGRKPPSGPGRRAATPVRSAPRRLAPSPPPTRPAGGPPAMSAAALRRPRPAPVDAIGTVRDLAALPRHACRWPIGDPKDPAFSWCGRSAPMTPTGRSPYCEGHRDRAYRSTAGRGPYPGAGGPDRRAA